MMRPSIQEDAQLRDAGVRLELGGHRAETLRSADLLVLSPGVSPMQEDVAAARAGSSVTLVDGRRSSATSTTA